MGKAARQKRRLERVRPGERVQPAFVPDLLGTGDANGEPSVTFEERRSRCFELATYAATFGVQRGDVPAGVLLVHGTFHGPGAPARIPHAWLLLPGRLVWEPIKARVYDRDAWYHWTDARDEITYGSPQAQQLVAAHLHFGPWHRESVRLEDREEGMATG